MAQNQEEDTDRQRRQKDPGVDNADHDDDAHNYKQTLKEAKK